MQNCVDSRRPATLVPRFTRRQWLAGAAGSFGALLLPAPARAALGAKARAAIVLFLQGGLSHFESFDPKPDAPVDVRGEFGSIATNVPGIRFTEHLPLLAQRLHRFSIVRSAHHPTPDHIQAIHVTLCGCELPGANIDFKNHNVSPAMGAVVAKLRGPGLRGLPGYVAVPHCDQLGRRLHYGDAGYLGPSFSPIDSGLLPTRADAPYTIPRNLALNPTLTVGRLQERVELMEGFEGGPRAGAFLHDGINLLMRGPAARAFDLNREPVEQRRRYGEHGMGQEAILARRLAESGVPFTLVNFALDQVKGQDWDTHEQNFRLMKNVLLPPLDRAVSTLLDDLHERGLLETTLVALLTEFGRTPKVNANAGRDHWPNVFSVLLAGGGIKPGIVVGGSTRAGDTPKDRPVHIYDVLATIYHQLGVPTNELFRDSSGRSIPVLAAGRPIPELL